MGQENGAARFPNASRPIAAFGSDYKVGGSLAVVVNQAAVTVLSAARRYLRFQAQTLGHSAQVGSIQPKLARRTRPVVLVAFKAGADDLPLIRLGRLA